MDLSALRNPHSTQAERNAAMRRISEAANEIGVWLRSQPAEAPPRTVLELVPQRRRTDVREAAMIARRTLLTLLLASSTASAVPITGAMSFSDGFQPGAYPDGHNTAIVSDMTVIRPGDTTLAFGCTGAFGNGACVPNAGTFAIGFSLLDGAQLVYQYNGFQFFGNIFGPVTRSALTCDAGLCSDSLVFDATGWVYAPGFDPTAMLMSWTGQGTCVQWPANTDAPPMTMCEGDVSASWSASVATQSGPSVPEPGTLALIGAGLIAVGLRRRA